ncbi:MAG: Zn-dependent protease with chaperone function [Nostocales cyanobacterium]|nr:MAG: Zn-dependent protease with chaperone function [Nostocales cyanobacterium]TAF15478.1 MAG: Zn-dependent protease with chaperone function [Nostocales cyanobacterium]
MPSSEKLALEAGLVALKQENYYAAITQLVPVANIMDNSNVCLQAQVGLVMAYAHTGEIDQAIAWCHHLMESENPQVQEWARRAFDHLIKRQKRQQSKQWSNYAKLTQQQAKISRKIKSQGVLSNRHRSNSQNKKTNSNTNTNNNYYWRQAKRAKVWQPLRKYSFISSRFLALATFIALFFLLVAMVQSVMVMINQILDWLPYVSPILFLYHSPSLLILGSLLFLLGFIPWLLDWMLAVFYQQNSLSKDELYKYSRETLRVIQRTCQMRHWQIPELKILPINAPIMFTYGNIPRTARIVVSQGLLEQLNNDEIATIYGLALGQIRRWDFWIMSLACLITLPIYQVYQQGSIWGDKSQNKLVHWVATLVANFSYCIWCLITGITFLTSRFRIYASDRHAAEITGNPNGLIRALLKISMGIAEDIKTQQQTSWELESLNILAPVDVKQSLCLGTVIEHLRWESFLMWESSNPYRQWFTINQSHPLIGDRLQRLCKIARHWHLEPELYFVTPELLSVKPQSFLLQIAPWLGIPCGLILAGLFWLSWQTAYTTNLFNLKWIYDDWSFVIGFLLIGFSVGTLMRINSFFPEINQPYLQNDQQALKLFIDPSILPIDSVSIRLVGKLIGHQGIGNSLSQDLILQTNIGLIKLHHIPWLSPSANPQQWIGKQITVTGWLRRGATPWIDIQTLETHTGNIINSPHPIWSTVLAVVAQALGAYIMLTAQLITR